MVKRTMKADVPAGVDDGQRLCLRGEGNAGLYGGPAGDLYIFLSVKPHKLFQRQGNDILYELSINFPQAALGDEIRVPSLDGKVQLKIPPGTQSGEVFRLKGKGVPYINAKRRGDLLVKVHITTPQRLDKDQRRLLQELATVLPRIEPPPET